MKVIYRDSDPNYCDFCLSDKFLDLNTCGEIEDLIVSFIADKMGGQYCRSLDKLSEPYYLYSKTKDAPFRVVAFVRPPTKTNSFKSIYLRYGNDASLTNAYAEVCLVEVVAPATDRM